MSIKKYLSIDERLSLIQDIQNGVYLVSNKRGYSVEKRNPNIFKHKCTILDVLDKLTDVTSIGSGSYGKAYGVCSPKKVCKQFDAFVKQTLMYSIKEIKYMDYLTYNTNLDNPDRYENSDIRMLQFLSSFVTQHATPHINMPIMTWVCIPAVHLHEKHQEELLPKRYIVSEMAEYGDLGQFISLHCKKWQESEVIWKVIFFQLLYTLAVIHIYFPNFLHNDLSPSNILVRPTNTSLTFTESAENTTYFEYHLKDNTYYIPDLGFQLLLWDFDFSTIAGKIDNDKVLYMISENVNLTMHKNRYYDIAMFFNRIKLYYEHYFPDEITDWLHDKVINNNFVTLGERVVEAIEYTTPLKLIEDGFFDNFKLKQPQHQIIEVYTGKVHKKFKFNGQNGLRYSLPQTCKFGDYTYIVNKTLNYQDQKLLQYRFKCKKSTDKDIAVYIPLDYTLIEEWIHNILSLKRVVNTISNIERKNIQNSAMLYLKEYVKYYYISTDTLYGVVGCCIMYSSYVHLLTYISPFNRYEWWIRLPNLKDTYTKATFIDIYKQFCAFIAKYIE